MMMAKSRNDAVISGNHHHSVVMLDADVLPRDDAVDHHEEGEAEDAEDQLVPPGELDVAGLVARPR